MRQKKVYIVTWAMALSFIIYILGLVAIGDISFLSQTAEAEVDETSLSGEIVVDEIGLCNEGDPTCDPVFNEEKNITTTPPQIPSLPKPTVSPAPPASAPPVSAFTPYGVFGGLVEVILSCDVLPCGSVPGVALFVGPPGVGTSNPLKPDWIAVRPWSTIYEYKQIRPDVWVLGTMSPPNTCIHFNGVICVWIPVKGDAVIMGTSR